MRIAIITPPFFVFTGPAAAPAYLCAILRRAGHDAIAFDTSRFCSEQILTQATLERSDKKIDWGRQPRQAATYMRRILPRAIGDSVFSLTSGSAFQSLEDYERSRSDVELACRMHALAHGATRWSSAEFHSHCDEDDPLSLLDATKSDDQVFDAALDAAAVTLLAFKPDLIAISLSMPQQRYGAFRLARALRRLGFVGHLTLGGSTVTLLRGAIARLPSLFDDIDSILLFSAEEAILDLAAAVDSGRDPVTAVPNLLARRDGIVVLTSGDIDGAVCLHRTELDLVSQRSLDELPDPIFDDLVHGQYLSPHLLLPVLSVQGCYYDRCVFCQIPRTWGQRGRAMSPERMASRFRNLAQSYESALFKDVSDALPPALAFDFANELSRRGGEYAWEGYFRCESAFANSDKAAALRRSGLRVAYLGVETGSPRLLEIMKKRTKIDVVENVIRCFAEAGIWVHTFFLVGHPGETEHDHDATLKFVGRNLSYIQSIQPSVFQLALSSDLASPSQSPLLRTRPSRGPSFALTVDYEPNENVPRLEVAMRRADEIRAVAYADSSSPLAQFRQVWDSHRIVFAVNDGAQQWARACDTAPHCKPATDKRKEELQCDEFRQ